MPKFLNHEKIQKKAQSLRKKGYTLNQIAESLEVSYPTLRKIYTDNSHKKDSENLKKMIKKGFKKGLSFAEIARQLNCSRQYAHKVVKNEST